MSAVEAREVWRSDSALAMNLQADAPIDFGKRVKNMTASRTFLLKYLFYLRLYGPPQTGSPAFTIGLAGCSGGSLPSQQPRSSRDVELRIYQEQQYLSSPF